MRVTERGQTGRHGASQKGLVKGATRRSASAPKRSVDCPGAREVGLGGGGGDSSHLLVGSASGRPLPAEEDAAAAAAGGAVSTAVQGRHQATGGHHRPPPRPSKGSTMRGASSAMQRGFGSSARRSDSFKAAPRRPSVDAAEEAHRAEVMGGFVLGGTSVALPEIAGGPARRPRQLL